MSCFFLCDRCKRAKRLDVFNVDCDEYGVTAKRIISDDQYPCEVCGAFVDKLDKSIERIREAVEE